LLTYHSHIEKSNGPKLGHVFSQLGLRKNWTNCSFETIKFSRSSVFWAKHFSKRIF
jgi:hypothetical protein